MAPRNDQYISKLAFILLIIRNFLVIPNRNLEGRDRHMRGMGVGARLS